MTPTHAVRRTRPGHASAPAAPTASRPVPPTGRASPYAAVAARPEPAAPARARAARARVSRAGAAWGRARASRAASAARGRASPRSVSGTKASRGHTHASTGHAVARRARPHVDRDPTLCTGYSAVDASCGCGEVRLTPSTMSACCDVRCAEGVQTPTGVALGARDATVLRKAGPGPMRSVYGEVLWAR